MKREICRVKDVDSGRTPGYPDGKSDWDLYPQVCAFLQISPNQIFHFSRFFLQETHVLQESHSS